MFFSENRTALSTLHLKSHDTDGDFGIYWLSYRRDCNGIKIKKVVFASPLFRGYSLICLILLETVTSMFTGRRMFSVITLTTSIR